MKFPYFKLKKGVERPIIKIEVKSGEKSLGYFALVDSGADMNIFHAEVGEALGIDIKSGLPGTVKGITEGESQIHYTHPVTLIIGGWKYETTVAFMPNLSKNGHGVLGQRDFFNLFKNISFDFKKKEVEIVRKNS